MNSTKLLRDIELLTRIEEAQREPGSTANPEAFGMRAILPILSPRWVDFVKRRMAFDLIHFSEQAVDEAHFQEWQEMREEVRDYLPKVPKDIGALPSGWKRVFRDVMQLYGNPNGK